MNWADRSLAFVLMAVAGGWIYLASRLPFPLFAQVSNVSPGDYPMAVAALLALLAIILLARTILSRAHKVDPPEELPAQDSPAAGRLLLGAAFFLAYVIFIPWVGFAVGSVFFVFGFLFSMAGHSLWVTGVLAVGIPALLWSIFVYLLTVPLPRGPWGF